MAEWSPFSKINESLGGNFWEGLFSEFYGYRIFISNDH